MTITVINLKSAVSDLEKDIDKEVEKQLRARALKAFADVKLMTPVDTGQARNSWYIGYTETYLTGEESSNITILAPKDKPQEIIVTNEGQTKDFLEKVLEDNKDGRIRDLEADI